MHYIHPAAKLETSDLQNYIESALDFISDGHTYNIRRTLRVWMERVISDGVGVSLSFRRGCGLFFLAQVL